MCELTKVSSRKKIRNFKIVAKKLRGKRYYSVALGFKYPLDGTYPYSKKATR